MSQHLAWRVELDEHLKLIAALRDVLQVAFEPAVDLLAACVTAGGKILICGAGGGCANAQAMAAALLVRYKTDRNPIPGIALTTDAATLTDSAEDYGYFQAFSRQITALGKPGDVLVAIASTGNQANVREAIHTARSRGLGTLSLSAYSGSNAGPDVDLPVLSVDGPRVREAHLLLIHMLVAALEQRIPQ